MALNCPRRAGDGEPCGECEDCSRIWGGHTSLDVVEIDAASNRGVDDARELRERAMYAPSEEERYKVYILDEAHMLTREAWNALLKILEEPPPRVIFVFATTEARKIQQTASPILSRCQRFDFRRIGTGDIMRRLHDVLDSEGIAGEHEALRAIARKANGGMRDGLSLLDQVLALSDEEVSVDNGGARAGRGCRGALSGALRSGRRTPPRRRVRLRRDADRRGARPGRVLSRTGGEAAPVAATLSRPRFRPREHDRRDARRVCPARGGFRAR